MILLFEEDELKFDNLGLGVLRDATSCVVKEELNGEYSLSMQYPISGINFDLLTENRIIYAKPNPYDEYQPFRIYSISRPIGGTVTLTAYHISYDLNGVICQPFKGGSLLDTITKIQNGMDDTRFKFINAHAVDDKYYRTYQITTPTNVKAILSADDKAVCGKDCYDCELKYDKWAVRLMGHRGSDRGEEIRYAKNMTDLTQEVSTENLYSAIYPFYHKETTSSDSSSTEDGFTKVYIVGKKPYQDGWFSFEENGEPYHPTSDNPVQVQTEGDFKDKVYAWDADIQRYVEKKYNETVTLISGVVEPTWIKIDWSAFPIVKAVAQVDGYFKSLTETEWTKYSAGDSVYEGKITNISGITGNMVLYFAEVIPPTSSSTTEEVSNITHVELDEKYLTTDDMADSKKMKHRFVKLLDLTSEFNEEPSKEKLREKAKEYIKENKLGKLKKTTDVSFINLKETTNPENFKILSRVELGDTIRVIYTNLGVDEKLRVITTEYNVLTNQFDNVELGEKKDSMSDNSIQSGDNVSSLSNNAGYTNESQVSKIITDTITADYIQAANAKLTKAQIEQLSVARIECSGILEASQFILDELVANKLTAENAKIAQTLEAGTVKVSGDITVLSGMITITGEDGTVFNVSREGKVTANDMNITGGSITIENEEGTNTFEVTNDGYLTARGVKIVGDIIATSGQIGDCVIDEQGRLIVPSANITGELTVGQISDFEENVTKITNDTISTTNVEAKNLRVEAANINGGITIGQIDKDAQNSIIENANSETERRLANAQLAGNTEISGYIIDKDGIRTFEGRDSDGKPTDVFDGLDTDKKNGVYLSEKGIRLGELPSMSPDDYSSENYCANGSIAPDSAVSIAVNDGLAFEKGKKYCVVYDIDFDSEKSEYPDILLSVYDSKGKDDETLLAKCQWKTNKYGSVQQKHENVYFEFETLPDKEPDLSFFYEYSKSVVSNVRIYRVVPKGFIVNSDGTLIATEGYIGGATIHGGVLRVPSAQITGKITADIVESNTGHIANFSISEKGFYSPDVFDSIDKDLTSFVNGEIKDGGVFVGTDGIRLADNKAFYEESSPIVVVETSNYIRYENYEDLIKEYPSSTALCRISVNGTTIFDYEKPNPTGFVVAFIYTANSKVVSGYPKVTSSYDELYSILDAAPIETYLILTTVGLKSFSMTAKLRSLLNGNFGGNIDRTFDDRDYPYVFIGRRNDSNKKAYEYFGSQSSLGINRKSLKCTLSSILETTDYTHEFRVTKDGGLFANYGKIGAFTLSNDNLSYSSNDDDSRSLKIGPDGIYLGTFTDTGNKRFSVTSDGVMHATAGEIGGFSINNALFSPKSFDSLDVEDSYKTLNGVTFLNTQGVFISPSGFRIGANAKKFFENVYTNKKNSLSILSGPQLSLVPSGGSAGDMNIIGSYFESSFGNDFYQSKANSENTYSYYIIYFETTESNLDIYLSVKNYTVYPTEDYGVISKLNKSLSHGNKISSVLDDDDTIVAKSYKGIKTVSSDDADRDDVFVGRTGSPGRYSISVKYIKQSSYDESRLDYLRFYGLYSLRSFAEVDWVNPESSVKHGGVYADSNGQMTIINGQIHGLLRGLSDSVLDRYRFVNGSIYYDDKLIVENGNVLADSVASDLSLEFYPTFAEFPTAGLSDRLYYAKDKGLAYVFDPSSGSYKSTLNDYSKLENRPTITYYSDSTSIQFTNDAGFDGHGNRLTQISVKKNGIITSMLSDSSVTDNKISSCNVNKLEQTEGDILVLDGGSAKN